MKEKIKKHYKFILGIVVGLILSSLVAYAATAVASKDITYDNSKSGLSATNVKDALDETYTKAKKISHCAEISGNAVTFKVGDYVQMTPSSTSYTTDTEMTGYTSTQTINPSELNLWRVIRINSDNTVDMVSEYISSTSLYFSGQTGYQNYVGYLNTIAHQYENSCYTVESRHMGYDGTQTPYITDTSALTSTTAPQTSTTSSSNVTSATEVKGLGDMGYETDYNLVNTALGTLAANKVGTTTAFYYWLASRKYLYFSSSYWYFVGSSIDLDGSLNSAGIYYYDGSNYNKDINGISVRPIVTLKSKIIPSGGDGSSSSPYILQ